MNTLDSLKIIYDTTFVTVEDTITIYQIENSDLGLSFWVPIIIAALALFISFYTVYLNKKHNELTVKPLLRIDWSFTKENQCAFYMINSGLGPAIISQISYFWDKKKIVKLTGDEITNHNFKMSFLDGSLDIWNNTFFEGESIDPHSKNYLIKVDFDEYIKSILEKEPMEKIEEHFRSHFHIIIKYKSIYDKEEMICELKM